MWEEKNEGEKKDDTGKTPVRLVTQLPSTASVYVQVYAYTSVYVYVYAYTARKHPSPFTALTLLRFSHLPLKPTLYTLKTSTHRGIPLYMYEYAHVRQ